MGKFRDFLEEYFNEIYDTEICEMISESEAFYTDFSQPWGDVKLTDPNPSKQDLENFYKKKVEPHLNKVRPEFEKILQNNKPDGAKIKSSKKSIRAFTNKAIDRKKGTEGIHDALRGAIITKDKDEAKEVADRLRKDKRTIEYEYKSPAKKDEFGYYGAHHIKMKTGDTAAEIQVMPQQLWKMKQKAHDIYVKHRTKKQDGWKKDAVRAAAMYRKGNEED